MYQWSYLIQQHQSFVNFIFGAEEWTQVSCIGHESILNTTFESQCKNKIKVLILKLGLTIGLKHTLCPQANVWHHMVSRQCQKWPLNTATGTALKHCWCSSKTKRKEKGRWHKKTFFQIRHAGGQVQMLNITNHKNANQSTTKYHLRPK